MSSNTEGIITRAVESDDELRLANDLMAKIHYADYFKGIEWLETCGVGYPHFLREHTRIALRNGELAGALRLITETIRLGEARLKMGGFGWVTTAPRHRYRGVANALMQDTIEYMKHHGYHVSMLFGIPNFYHRFGFITTLADYTIMVSAAEGLAAGDSPFRTRPAKPGDISAIQKMHNANDGGVACSILRSAAHITNKWQDWCKHLLVLTTAQGKVVAYLHAHPTKDAAMMTEVGVVGNGAARSAAIAPGAPSADPAICRAVLRAAAERARQQSLGVLRFHVPPPHPFGRFLLQYASTHEMRIERDCGGMMAFIDLAETLESMIPEWENCLAQSAARDSRVECTLVVDRKPYRVRANRGAIDVAAGSGKNKLGLTSAELMHLLTGYRHLDDIYCARRRIITPEARALLPVLFPKRHTYVWHFDRF
ncbi:MAG TPA: GNAT family N-acetyltransferase [Candidatus Hydrogenedentes bacterium]|nr:GNAT family N-acetyltransferase [Candidatus Hydrogenedentota bacterium]HPG65730.1 GNAT family N-acetyltransferase [Candidatus Hydrogenedentota bacterium]